MNTQTTQNASQDAQAAPAAQDTATPAVAPRVMVTLEDGRSVQAMTPEVVQNIVDGMMKKGKALTQAHDGKLIEGIKVIGDGNFVESKIGPRFIYNTDLLSEVAFSGNKLQEAADEMNAAIDAAGGDLLKVHTAGRKFLNALTVSFSVPTAKFNNGELVQAQVELVTTERGSLITLRNVSHQRAERLRPTGKGFNLSALLDARKGKVTELADTSAQQQPAPALTTQQEASAVTAPANAQS